MAVKCHATQQRLLQIFSAGEPVRFKNIGNTPIESLDHAVWACVARSDCANV